MRRSLPLLILLLPLLLVSCGKASDSAVPVLRADADSAMKYLLAQTAVVPRHSGSDGARKTAEWIAAEARSFPNVSVEIDEFTETTPEGPVVFRNVTAVLPGKSRKFYLVGAHYDAKKLELCPDFQAANDGASGVAVLLSVLKTVSGSGVVPEDTLRFCFFDGEEARVAYSSSDGLHGSRRAAAKLTASGEKKFCLGMILADMVGDRDLKLALPKNSHPGLRRKAFQAAAELGFPELVADAEYSMLDDHVPFLEAGIPAVDLIDFEYGPGNAFWHSPADTADKVSSESLVRVSDLILRMLFSRF